MSEWHVALLRGINVGTAKRVAMADLRALVESLGYGDVKTLLNSGNVVFTTSAAKGRKAGARIEQALREQLGVSSRVFLLNRADMDTIVEENSLLPRVTNPSKMFVSMLADPADITKLHTIVRQSWEPDAVQLGARAAYVWCENGLSQSKLAEVVLRALGTGVTTRNWATMLKLQAITSS